MKMTSLLYICAYISSSLLLSGCNGTSLIYIYDIQNDKLIAVKHYEYKKPGLLVGNTENISYSNSTCPYFITTQIFDRQQSSFVIKKRDYCGVVIESKIVILGESVDYTLGGGFCVNSDMTKGVVLSYPKERKFLESINEWCPAGPRDLIYYDFTLNTSRVIATTDEDEENLYFTWLCHDKILFVRQLFADNQIISIIDASDLNNIKTETIFTTLIDFKLSSDREKIYYRKFDEYNQWNIIYSYDINTKRHDVQSIPIELFTKEQIIARFQFENSVYFLTTCEVKNFNIEKGVWDKRDMSTGDDFDLEGMATWSGLLLTYKKTNSDEQGHFYRQEKYSFIPKKSSDKIIDLDIKNMSKWYIGYEGKYILFQK